MEGIDAKCGKLELSLLRTADILCLGPLDMRVSHRSDLDIGKGMGSSTADIVASARALANATGHVLRPEQEAGIATSIESSDGSMYPGIVAFEQKTSRLVRRFDWWPQFVVVMVIPPTILNTETARFAGKERHADQFEQILEELDRAVLERDPLRFARQATVSAELNQRFVPNAYYLELISRLDEFKAAGVNVAHTGTMAGLLFEMDAAGMAAAAKRRLQAHLSRDVRIEMTTTPPCPG